MPVGWDVESPHVLELVVEAGDLDEFGHANNVVFLRWLERVAWSHSKSLGLGMDDYRRLGCGCVVRRHELDYLAPALLGDKLALATWVDENDGRLSMWRGYQIVRHADRRTLLRGRTHWVCVDLATGRPRRMPPEFVSGYPVAKRDVPPT